MTDEGEQLQAGLRHAGWTLAGYGYDDDCCDVPELLERHKPDVVFVQDARDWDPRSRGCFDPRVSFTNVGALRLCPAFKVIVVKDAGSVVQYQRDFADAIRADAAIIYYHPRSVLAVAPWLAGYRLIRTYHSVDTRVIDQIDLTQPRKRCLISGAISGVYPLRRDVWRKSHAWDIDRLRHPGYGNAGCVTNDYLRTLAGYKAHVATASRYGFALRKIVESVAVGCTPVTNLPAYDVLPEIDAALIRVPSESGSVRSAVDAAERDWNFDSAMRYAVKAASFYDWRAAGLRLSESICRMAGAMSPEGDPSCTR